MAIGGQDIEGFAVRFPKGTAYSAIAELEKQKQAQAGAGYKPVEAEKGLLSGVAQEDAYFDQLRDLNVFVEDAMAKGLDPVRPNIADPDSMLVNRIYRTKLARVEQLANQLKYFKELEKTRTELEMKGEIIPTAVDKPTSLHYQKELAPTPEEYRAALPTKLLPSVEKYAQAFAGKTFPTRGAARRADEAFNQAKADVEASVDNLRKTGRYNEQDLENYRQRQLSSLEAPAGFKPPRAIAPKGPTRDTVMLRKQNIKFFQLGEKEYLDKVIGANFLGKNISKVEYLPKEEGADIQLYHYDAKAKKDIVFKTVDASEFSTINNIFNKVTGQEKLSDENLAKYPEFKIEEEERFEKELEIDVTKLDADIKAVQDVYKKGGKDRALSVLKDIGGMDDVDYDSETNELIILWDETRDYAEDRVSLSKENNYGYDEIRDMIGELPKYRIGVKPKAAKEEPVRVEAATVTEGVRKPAKEGEALTERQKMAINAFKREKGRELTETERQRILKQFK